MKTTISMIAILLLAAVSVKAEDLYTVSDISVRQRWPWSKKVDIDFLVSLPPGGNPTVGVDVTVMAKDGSTPLSISQSSLSGDISLVGPGWRRIVWDPTVDYPNTTFTQFNVTLSVTRSKPTYMIVDLRKQLGDDGFITYRYEKGVWDAATNYNNCYYCFIMRRVPATTSDEWKAISGGKDYFVLGSPTTEYARNSSREGPNNCRLTNDFWVSHIELSEGQLYNAGAGSVQSVRRAQRSYDAMRGTVAQGINWPSTDHAVADGSILKILRDRTGLEFDLPTEAEWEYACRAGTTTPFADGVYKTTYTDADYEASMNTLGRCKTSGGTVWNDPPYAYSPNGWGIFDMHGNHNEWCLDWMIDNVNAAQADPMINPVGPPSSGGNTRAVRNGGATSSASGCRSATRSHAGPGTAFGVRLVCPYTDPAQ